MLCFSSAVSEHSDVKHKSVSVRSSLPAPLTRHPPKRDGRVLATYGGKEDGHRSSGGGGVGAGGKGTGATTNGKHQWPSQQRQDGDEEPSLKFLMLNPAVHFDEIVEKVSLELSSVPSFLLGLVMVPICFPFFFLTISFCGAFRVVQIIRSH